MTKKIKISELPVFDAAEFLKDDEDMAAYLSVVIEENDPALLAAALGDIARARGMREIATAAGIGRESLYKALRPGASPRFDTISRVCDALGLKLTVAPKHAAA
jgi:probable addiction module antidote protein